MRYQGHLKMWNAERGFGFVVADEGGAELFVHVSAFVTTSPPPSQGERLTFEVEPGRDGRKRAVRVRRVGEEAAKPSRQPQPRSSPSARSHHSKHKSGVLGRLVSGVLVCALIGLGYSQYAKRAAVHESLLPALPASLPSVKLAVPEGFRCDGRTMCSQMTSCREAKLFLQNCPGTQMDGNGDGVPCEQQWCTGH